MQDTEHYQRLENMYHSAPCNAYYEPKMAIQEGTATLTIPIKQDFFHAAGAVHGGVYFKALDDAAFFAANSLVSNVFVLTNNFTVYFVRPISAGLMVAEGHVLNMSRNQILAEAMLSNEQGKLIGKGSGTFVKSTIELTEEIGYK